MQTLVLCQSRIKSVKPEMISIDKIYTWYLGWHSRLLIEYNQLPESNIRVVYGAFPGECRDGFEESGLGVGVVCAEFGEFGFVFEVDDDDGSVHGLVIVGKGWSADEEFVVFDVLEMGVAGCFAKFEGVGFVDAVKKIVHGMCPVNLGLGVKEEFSTVKVGAGSRILFC